MKDAPFLIIETGLPAQPVRRYGHFDHWIRVGARLRRDEAVTCHVHAGDELPEHDGWCGVFVTGSASMVTERLAWSEQSASWLQEAHRQRLPVFGICYGHQLIAQAFGGRVDFHPRGREMGTVPVHLRDGAQQDPLFAGLPAQFRAQTTHLQSVLDAPPEAVVLADSPHEPCNAFRIGSTTWGVQFHPEFSTPQMRGYIRARADVLRKEGLDPQALWKQVNPAPHSRALLSRFVRHARHDAA
ncbi:MAG: glutamine amidotransferase [Xanthomonadales bacterium]|nr:glutamine amidotransferase [Xanthomonadales bacterium]